MSEILSGFDKWLHDFKAALKVDIRNVGWFFKPRLSDEEFQAEYGQSKEEYTQEHGKGATKIAELTPEEREKVTAEAEAEQREAWEEQKRQMEAEEAERQRKLQEEREYQARGGRTQEEYDQHMEESRKAAQGGDPFEVYRGVKIYRTVKESSVYGTYYNYKFIVNDRSYGSTDQNVAHEIINRELDAQPTVDEQVDYAQARNTRTREQVMMREQEISSTPEAPPTETLVSKTEKPESTPAYRDRHREVMR